MPQPGGVTGDIYEPDNTPDQASTIIPNAAAQIHSLDTTADVDWAKFTLTQDTGVKIQTAGSHGDTELQLFTAADTTDPILTDDNSGAGLFSLIKTNLAAGTYFVRVNDAGATPVSRYTLGVTTFKSVAATTPAAIARPLGTLIGSSQVQGQLGGATNNVADVFSFSVVQPILLNVQVTTPILGWQLLIFDANGNPVQPQAASNFITGGNANTETFALAAGDYSLVIDEPLPLISTFEQNPTVQAAGTVGVPDNVAFPGTAANPPVSAIMQTLGLLFPNFPVGVVGGDLTIGVGTTGVLDNANPLPGAALHALADRGAPERNRHHQRGMRIDGSCGATGRLYSAAQ